MCHSPSRIEPDLLMKKTSHTAISLRKAVTIMSSRLRVAQTTPESATVK